MAVAVAIKLLIINCRLISSVCRLWTSNTVTEKLYPNVDIALLPSIRHIIARESSEALPYRWWNRDERERGIAGRGEERSYEDVAGTDIHSRYRRANYLIFLLTSIRDAVNIRVNPWLAFPRFRSDSKEYAYACYGSIVLGRNEREPGRKRKETERRAAMMYRPWNRANGRSP